MTFVTCCYVVKHEGEQAARIALLVVNKQADNCTPACLEFLISCVGLVEERLCRFPDISIHYRTFIFDKVNANFFLEQTMKAQRGSKGIALFFL